jgi:chromosome segregation ATPase
LGRHPSLTNEQHFLYQSQAALVARISELERTLSSRSQTRPISFAASDSSLSDAEPSDEMLRLIADLKAERDELKRDIDGWRTRVSDLEKKSGALALRVDTERREAWIARERLSLLEVEKRAAVRAAEESDAAAKGLRAELATYQGGSASCAREAEHSKEIAHELERVRAETGGRAPPS